MRHILSDFDLSAGDMLAILQLASKIKLNPERYHESLKGKTLLMLFEKTSTRTRVSFETAMTQLGGHAIFLDYKTSQIAKGETLADTSRVLGRYCDTIMARLYRQLDLEEIAKHAGVPVINALTEMYHPCQALGDLLTVLEKKGGFKGTISFVGDCGFNMAHSTMISFSKLGMDVRLVCPKNHSYMPNPDVLKKARKSGKGRIEIVHDPNLGVKGADVVYTDVWISMGQEEEKQQRERDFKSYQVNSALLSKAKPDAILMHCLPAMRGYEVTDEVLDGPQSVVFDQAENRLHAQKAVLVWLLGKV